MNDIKELFRYLEGIKDNMNPSQIRFVESLKKYFKRTKMLTDKQLVILYEIRNNLRIKETGSLE